MATTQQRTRMLCAFRSLLRARDFTFKGDKRMQKEMTKTIKTEFYKNRYVSGEAEIDNLINTAEEAVQFVRYGIIQASKTSNQSEFNVKLTEEHVLANLDAEINLKSVDKKMIERMEKKIQK